MLTPGDPCMSRLKGIHYTFSHYYINVREEFDHYEYITCFNSKIKSKHKRFHRKKKRRINWHGVKGEKDSQLSATSIKLKF